MSDSIKEMANRFYNLPEPKEEVNLHKGMFHLVKAMELVGIRRFYSLG